LSPILASDLTAKGSPHSADFSHMKKKLEGLFFTVLLLTFARPALGPPDQAVFAQEIRGVIGESVAPRAMAVRDMPKVSALHVGPVAEIPEGEVPGGNAAFEDWKRRQPPVHVQHNVTIDPSGSISLAPLAPSVGVGFEGTTQQGYIPGEPQPAVGPTEVFVIGNVSVVIANKDGTGRTEVLQSDFFGIPSSEGPGFDAKCFYDALRGRFVALAESQGSSGSTKWSYYYLGISKTSDARGDWWIYKFNMRMDGTSLSSNWSDFPGLGVSDDKLVMSGQQFSFSGNSYQYQKLRVIDRSLAYSGATVTYVDFYKFSAPPSGDIANLFVTKPGRNVSLDPTIYLFTTRYSGGSNVAYRTITGSPSSPSLSGGTLINVNPYGAAVDVQQLGSSNLLDAGDCRTPDFFVRNGVLTIAWHFGNNFGSGTVDAIRYFQLRTSDQSVLTDETFGADGIYYYYPMACVDSAGTMFMGFCRSSSNEYSSSWVTGKRRSDAGIEASTLAKVGVVGNGQSRWGDFTGIDMDETGSGASGSVAWYSGLWAKGSNEFGTWASQISFSYGTIGGQVLQDADADSTTSSDRTPLSGWTVTLMQGASTVASTAADKSGNYSFGYLETGTYDIVLTVAGGYFALATVLGAGGTSQSKINKTTIEVNLTNAQLSSGNTFLVSQKVVASIKVFLEGPYSNGSMRTDLNLAGYIPSSQPYNTAPWNYAGTESAGSIPSGVVDWVLVQLRSNTTTTVATRAAFVKSDGTVVDLDGTSPLNFQGVVAGNYYIVVRHRNHLAVMSAHPTALSLSSGLYDFTASQAQAFGISPLKSVGTVFAMFCGDADANGGIGASDLVNVRASVGSTMYNMADVDMNGGVGASDLVLVRSNIGQSSQVP
jgi:hypothetical protein